MARPRKMDTDKILKVVYEYFQNECCGDVNQLKYKRIAEYAEKRGYPLKEHDVRRNTEVRTYIEKLKNNKATYTDDLLPVYRCMDITAFLNMHSNRTSLAKALSELDDCRKDIYNAMVELRNKNKGLVEEIERLKAVIAESEQLKKRADETDSDNNSLIAENRYLKKMLREYLYSEVAEKIINGKSDDKSDADSKRLSEYMDINTIPKPFDAAINRDIALKCDEDMLISRIRRLCDEE